MGDKELERKEEMLTIKEMSGTGGERMTCGWWQKDDDSKHGGYYLLWDDYQDCPETRDTDCCEYYERRAKEGSA